MLEVPSETETRDDDTAAVVDVSQQREARSHHDQVRKTALSYFFLYWLSLLLI